MNSIFQATVRKFAFKCPQKVVKSLQKLWKRGKWISKNHNGKLW